MMVATTVTERMVVADRYCRNCGQELPEDSRFCLNCGRPVHETAQVPTPEADVSVPSPPQESSERTFLQKWWPWILVLVVVALIMINTPSGGGGGGGNSASSNNPPSVAENEEKPEEKKQQPARENQANEGQKESYGIGDTVPVGDVSYKVTGARQVRQLPDPYRIDPPMKGNFILITFVFTNNGNDPANVSDIGLYLYDSQNREYETDTDATMNLPQDKSIFLLDRVNPGLSRTVQTVYSVPPNAKGFELEVTSGFWATESARIRLGF